VKPYQERVVQEKKDLDVKIEALKTFIEGDAFHEVEEDEQKRMLDQLEAMDTYSEILGDRIDNFEE
jgi:hypothetical protein